MLELGIKNIAMSTIKNICWMEIGKIRHVWMQCYSDDGWIFFFKIDCKVTFIWIPFQNQNGISRLVIGDSPGKNEIRADYSFFYLYVIFGIALVNLFLHSNRVFSSNFWILYNNTTFPSLAGENTGNWEM